MGVTYSNAVRIALVLCVMLFLSACREASYPKGGAILKIMGSDHGDEGQLFLIAEEGDNVLLGDLPVTIKDFKAGTYDFVVKSPYFLDKAFTLELAVSQVTTKKVTLVQGAGVVTVLTDPDGSVVEIDGRRAKDLTPLSLSLSSGVHSLTVYNAGYQAETRQVRVFPGKTILVDHTFLEERIGVAGPGLSEFEDVSEKNKVIHQKLGLGESPEQMLIAKYGDGVLYITTQPEKATITLDGSYQGVSQITVKSLSATEHRITAAKSGYITTTKKFHIEQGQINKHHINLLEKDSIINVYSDPDGAEIGFKAVAAKDYQIVGVTPSTIKPSKSGNYAVQVVKLLSATKRYYWYKEIKLKAGELLNIEAGLTLQYLSEGGWFSEVELAGLERQRQVKILELKKRQAVKAKSDMAAAEKRLSLSVIRLNKVHDKYQHNPSQFKFSVPLSRDAYGKIMKLLAVDELNEITKFDREYGLDESERTAIQKPYQDRITGLICPLNIKTQEGYAYKLLVDFETMMKQQPLGTPLLLTPCLKPVLGLAKKLAAIYSDESEVRRLYMQGEFISALGEIVKIQRKYAGSIAPRSMEAIIASIKLSIRDKQQRTLPYIHAI